MADILDFRVKNGLAVTTTATIESTLAASSTNTSALVVAGGVGIGKNLVVGANLSATTIIATGDVDITSNTGATTSTGGALTVTGGVGIGENLYVGNKLYVGSTEESSNPSSGALVIEGGLGVGGNFYVGGTLYATIDGTITTSTNLLGGTANQIPYQSAPGVTNFFGPGTAGQLLVSNGTTAGGPVFTNTASIFVGNATIATNVRGGAAGSIVYQSGANASTSLAIGAAGTILTSSGTAPQWTTTGTLVVARANTATGAETVLTAQRNTAAVHYLTFADSNDLTAAYNALYTTSTIVYNPATARLTVGGTTAPNATLDVQGTMFVSGVSTVTNTTNATSTGTGALQVRGGAAVGLNLYVGSSATILSQLSSTSTLQNNALYVAGGVGIGKTLYVTGEALFQNNVTFAGTTTNVFSTNTVYTDNFIDLHYPSGGTGSGVWLVDDGKDIGHIFHHYKDGTGDDNGALIWHNASDELRWYMGNMEYVGGSQVWNFSTATYGKFRTGAIYLESTATSLGTDTGALTVAGGAGIAGDLYVGGVIYGVANVSGVITTATNFQGGTTGQVPFQSAPGVTSYFGPGSAGQILVSQGTTSTGPAFTSTSSIYVNDANTSTNVRGGNVGQLVYQSEVGSTNFVGTGTLGQLLVSQGTTSTGPAFVDTSSIYVGFAANSDKAAITNDVATAAPQYVTFVSTSSGYNDVKTSAGTGLVYWPSTGNFGISTDTPRSKLDVNGNSYLRGITTVTNTTNATTTATGAFQVTGGAAVGLDLRVGGLVNVGSTLNVGSNATVTGDLAVNGGDITSSAATFNLLNATVTTLNLAGSGTAITVGATTGYTAIRNLTTITNTTNSTSTLTGALRVVGGAGIQGNVYVGGTIYGNVDGTITNANTATNLRNGTAGQVPYQTAPGVTSFYGPGTAGELLTSGGTGAPVYVGTTTVYVGNAVTATNLRAGLAGSLPYQSGAGATTFLGIGTNGYLLLSNGTAPTWVDPATIGIGKADAIKTVSVSTNTDHYLTFVDTNNASADYEAVYTDAGLKYNPSTNNLTVTGEIGRIAQGSAYTFARMSADNSDITLLRVDAASSGTAAGDSSNYGFNIKYMGSRSGNDNSLSIWTDNQLGPAQIEAITFLQDGVVRLNAGTDSSSTATGNLVVVGGVGINKKLSVGGIATVLDTTNATSTSTGALQVRGGVGINSNLFVGGTTSTFLQNIAVGAVDPATSLAGARGVVIYGTDEAELVLQTSHTGATGSDGIRLYTGFQNARLHLEENWNFGVGVNGEDWITLTTASSAVIIQKTTAASSTITGALQVKGGAGIGGNLYVGGTIYGTFDGTVTGTATTATNLANGTAGQIPYQASPGLTSFFGPGSAGDILTSNGINSPQYVNTGTVYVGNAVTATNIRAGAGGSLPYQSAANATTFLGIGAAGTLLQSSGTAPQWVTTGSLVAGNAENANNIRAIQRNTAGVHYLTFVDSNNAANAYEALYTSATIVYNPGTRFVGIGTGTPDTNLHVVGGTRITGVTTVTDTTAASSNVTGAFQVAGGVGIGGNIYAGGNAVITGDVAVNGGDITSTAVTFGLVDATVTTLNFARAATAITIGATTGGTTIRNITTISTNTAATTSTNGALIVSGGAGFAGDIRVAADVFASDILPHYDNTGVVGNAGATWANGQFTDLTIDNVISVRGAVDLADSDILQFGASDDVKVFYDGTANVLNVELEADAQRIDITDNGTQRINIHKSGGLSISGVTTVTNTTAATASTSGALVVAGGVGIGGNLYVGGTIYGTVSVTGSITTASNLAGGVLGNIPYQSAPGITAFVSTGTSGQFLQATTNGTPAWTNTASMYVNSSVYAEDLRGGAAGSIAYQSAANTTVFLSLSGTQNSLITAGASAPQYVTNVRALSGTASNTTSTGQSLQVTSGGLGVAGNSYIGGDLGIEKTITVAGNIASNGTTTGTVVVTGGVGISGDVYAAGGQLGNIRVGITGDNEIDTSSGNLTIDSAGGTVTVDDNLTVVGNLTVQGTTTYIDSTVTNVADPIFTIGGGVNGAAPTSDDNKDRGIAFQWHNGTNARTGFFGFDDSTGFFTFISSATFTNEVVAPAGGTTRGAVDANLAGGTAMSIPYQSAPNTTAFLAAGTSGYILQTNGTGSAPTWVAASSLGAGSATSLNTVAQTANANYFLTFVDSNNASATAESFYTSSTIYYNPATANLVIGGDLTVSGGQITMDTASTRDKYRVYNDSNYTIGFQSGVTFGAVNNDWAMTFQNSNNNTRGFWWGDTGHSTAQGAMALSTDGKLTVAHSVRIGFGESDVTVPGSVYALEVNGAFAATTKSFLIDHPTKPGMKLRYGSLEGPENGVYVRGRLTGNNVIELPDYWTGLVDADSITVTLTAVGEYQKLYVKDIKDNTVIIGGSKAVDCFYTVWAERKDVDKLEVEIK